MNYCTMYGFSGKTEGTSSCELSEKGRKITCRPGYVILPSNTTSIFLAGDAVFPGCVDLNECDLYGYSGKTENVLSCENSENSRTITCKPGYYAEAPTTRSVTLTGNAVFKGCVDIDECAVYGYSGKPEFTESCINGNDQRKITCFPGYQTSVLTHESSITLNGSYSFGGCVEINECEVYEYSGHPENVESCVDGVNNRTITCGNGYLATLPDKVTVTFLGNASFPGCYLDYCKQYGFSGKFENTLSCVTGDKFRNITCMSGYWASTAPLQPWIVIHGSDPFLGCADYCGDGLRTCDDGNREDGDGCSKTCTTESGWVCPPSGACCRELEPTIKTKFPLLTCTNSWWSSLPGSPAITVEDEFAVSDDFRYCGAVTVSKEGRFIINGATVTIAGNLHVESNGTLMFQNSASGRLNIIPPCPEVVAREPLIAEVEQVRVLIFRLFSFPDNQY
eukprot:TRINITY_DN2003_c0_g1_i2.p1 TRINITY_DN2003_c0_g1~~TRINITY_DN2003_c0_g1_i2.p1  ORF type:complete len:450 (+),score=55.19 TRINITY_DN2003_c0_g1_i2:1130-2479(+)